MATTELGSCLEVQHWGMSFFKCGGEFPLDYRQLFLNLKDLDQYPKTIVSFQFCLGLLICIRKLAFLVSVIHCIIFYSDFSSVLSYIFHQFALNFFMHFSNHFFHPLCFCLFMHFYIYFFVHFFHLLFHPLFHPLFSSTLSLFISCTFPSTFLIHFFHPLFHSFLPSTSLVSMLSSFIPFLH